MTGAPTAPGDDAPRALRASAALLLLELGCILLAVRDAPVAAVMLHVGCCAATAGLALRRVTRTPAAAALKVVAITLPFLGPVAALAGVVILAVAAAARDPVANAALWHEHLFPNLAVDALTQRAEEIGRRQPGVDGVGEIESFFDVLRWGTLPEKEHVLSLVSRSFRPEFAPVLRAGLAVDDLGLRAQAAAGLSMLETRISARLGDLGEAFRAAAPDQRDAAATELALALSDAAHTGLYDEARSAEMRREIVSVLAGRADAADPRVAAMLGRTLIQLGEVDRAVETLSGVASIEVSGDAAFSWLLEGVFRQSDFARLGLLVESRAEIVRRVVRQDGPLAPALRFWGAAA